MEEKRINKCLKSYLIAKKYCDSDVDKSFEYFKQCVRILNEIKDNNIKINDNLASIIEETETECSKYLTKTIKTNIEIPLIKDTNKIQNNNELFEIIETGNIDKIKKYNFGEINFNIYNNQGLTPLHYAINFGDTLFIKHALKLGACIDQTNIYGHTLLEFACLEKDPNMINFLLNYGANMKKHLLFRKNKKYFNNCHEIDIILLEIFILESSNILNSNIKYLNWIFEYINPDDNINIGLSQLNNSTIFESNISFKTFICKLDILLSTLDETLRNTYISIIKEELKYNLLYKLGCPNKKIDILLYNLVPFIDFGDIQLSWLISLEIKFLILKIFKNKTKINIKELKNELNNLLYENYIKSELYPSGLIQIVMSQWISKIKV
jgi:ankyrin repeat protein